MKADKCKNWRQLVDLNNVVKSSKKPKVILKHENIELPFPRVVRIEPAAKCN